MFRLQQPRAGSDYVNFIQRLGIPIVDIRYTYNSVRKESVHGSTYSSRPEIVLCLGDHGSGSGLFFYLTCPHTTTFVLLSIFSLSGTISFNKITRKELYPSWRNVHFRFPSVTKNRRLVKLANNLCNGVYHK